MCSYSFIKGRNPLQWMKSLWGHWTHTIHVIIISNDSVSFDFVRTAESAVLTLCQSLLYLERGFFFFTVEILNYPAIYFSSLKAKLQFCSSSPLYFAIFMTTKIFSATIEICYRIVPRNEFYIIFNNKLNVRAAGAVVIWTQLWKYNLKKHENKQFKLLPICVQVWVQLSKAITPV